MKMSKLQGTAEQAPPLFSLLLCPSPHFPARLAFFLFENYFPCKILPGINRQNITFEFLDSARLSLPSHHVNEVEIQISFDIETAVPTPLI